MGKDDIENPFTAYSTIGAGYKIYLSDIRNIYTQVATIMHDKAKVVIEVSNIKNKNSITTLAWDIAEEVSKVLHFEGEIIVDWDSYGYGYSHSYCLLFAKP